MPITVVLVEPEKPGNTGAICRVMKNFGFSNLLLLNPQFKKTDQELKNRAKWAQDVAKAIKIKPYSYYAKLKKDFDYVITTTARIGRDYNIPRSPITPEQLADRLLEINLKKTSIALVMGREGSGLNNEEILVGDFVVTIPASKTYATLNLSHATAIILYDLAKKLNEEHVASHITPVSAKEKEQLLKMVDAALDTMVFATPEKKETQRIVWKKMVAKSFLSKREAYALMGFLKKVNK